MSFVQTYCTCFHALSFLWNLREYDASLTIKEVFNLKILLTEIRSLFIVDAAKWNNIDNINEIYV